MDLYFVAMALGEYSFHNSESLPDPDLMSVHQTMLGEPTLLHPGIGDLKDSYDAGMAAVMTDESGVVCGYARLSPLVAPELRTKLGLPSTIPEVWEIGSAVIQREHRGNGRYSAFRRSLLQAHINAIHEGKVLVLGTTKNIAVMKVLPDAAVIGINFYPCVHTEFPMIAPLTCVCEPDFGSGFQHGAHCDSRTTQVALDTLLKNLSQENQLRSPQTACTMYVSDYNLAATTNAALVEHFGSQEGLISALKAQDYF